MSDYVSQNFGMVIGETITCLTFNQNNPPKVFKNDLFILPLGEISHKKGKLRPISHKKRTRFDKNCVTMN